MLSEMQQQYGKLEEELNKARQELAVAEEEKLRALDELREMKKVAETANTSLSEALSSQTHPQEMSNRVNELEHASIESAKKRDQAWQLELEAVQKQHALDVDALSSASQELERLRTQLSSAKDAALREAGEARTTAEANAKRIMELSSNLRSVEETLNDTSEELEIKQKNIESLQVELQRRKSIDTDVTEKDASLENLKHELHSTRESEPKTVDLLSEATRVQALEHEVDKAKESEAKMTEALLCQTKQLEETKILLEEAKLEITSLQKKIQSLEESVGQSNRDLDVSHRCLEKAKIDTHSIKEVVETLKSQLQVAKEGHAHSQEGEELALSKVRRLTQEITLLKAEVKLSMDAEEKSKNAMDDLALVVVELSKENKELKETLRLTKSELDSAKEEANMSKQMLKPTEEKFQTLLEESRKEIDQHKSVSERLKLEAEDSILAWNQKELEFVNCIKRADEESNASKQENSKLKMSLRMAEDVAKVAREENCKLRDILKQALNETTAAKEAAEIAKEENSQLKDNLLDKDDVLQELTRENERLRIKETAGYETIKELKKMLSSKSAKDLKAEDMDRENTIKKQNSLMMENKDSQTIKDILSLKFEEPKIQNGGKNEDEDPEMVEMLKGSIFDVIDSPENAKPVSHHRKTTSSLCTDDGEALNLEDIEHLDGTQLDDTEDKNSQRKKRALLRRFGELIRKRNFHRRETSVG